jgi:hypothetical protein
MDLAARWQMMPRWNCAGTKLYWLNMNQAGCAEALRTAKLPSRVLEASHHHQS